MLYKYCPQCFSLDVRYNPEKKTYYCNSCKYEGEMKSDTLDKINSLKKANSIPKPTFSKSTVNPLISRDSGSSNSRIVSKTTNTPKELHGNDPNRLAEIKEKHKNENSEDFEFL
jgi:hypothetical protein